MDHRSSCYWAGAVAFMALLAMGANAVPVTNFNSTDRGSTVPLYSAMVSPCTPPSNMPGGCQLIRGSSHLVTIMFNSGSRPMESISHDIRGKVMAAWPRFPELNGPPGKRDACSLVSCGCPVPANTNVTYSYSVAISRYFPKIPVPIQYTLFGRWRSSSRRRPTNVRLISFELSSEIVSN